MFTIDNISVEEKIGGVHFACDLEACKGACCTLKGGRGAPVSDGEVDEIFKAYPVIKKYLSADHREWIEHNGLVEGVPGYYATQCVNEEACVFVHYENGIAKCSFEKAFHKKEIGWRKPLSCHLFPLRMNDNLAPQLRFEFLAECEPAFRKGEREGSRLYRFLETVLVRAFGTDWYKKFERQCHHDPAISRRSE